MPKKENIVQEENLLTINNETPDAIFLRKVDVVFCEGEPEQEALESVDTNATPLEE